MNVSLIRGLIISILLICGFSLNLQVVYATDVKQEINSTTDNKSLEELDQSLADLEKKRQTINHLKKQLTKSKGITRRAYEARLDKAWLQYLQQGLRFAESVAAEQDSQTEISRYRKQATGILQSQYDVGIAVVKRLRNRMDIPEPSLSAADQAAAYSKLFDLLSTINQAYEIMLQGIEFSESFNIEISKQKALLKEDFIERAANGSILLEMAMNHVTALRASASAMPDDTELKAKLTVATNQVQSLADGLATVLAMMDRLEMDTAVYHEQVLSSTGQITTEVFEVGVVTNLLVGWGQTLWNVMIEDGPNLVFKVLLFIVIVFGFRKLADFVQTIVQRSLDKSHLKLSELLRRMLVSIARNIIIVLGVLIALSQVGISLGPLLAGLGVVGFVVGFALQDSLSNFASGMMILMYRPFDVGDLIEAGGVSGKVSQMSLVNTTILTLDNQTIVVPNSKIWGDVVKNVTAQTMRRVDMVFGISYTDDIPKTERVLQEILDSHEKVLTDPEPMVRLHELADSSVNFIVRPWVNMGDYWDVYWDVTRAVKMRFDEEGISIPFPQRDVHLYNE